MANYRIEQYLDAILAAIAGGEETIPAPAWRIEEYLAAIYEAIGDNRVPVEELEEALADVLAEHPEYALQDDSVTTAKVVDAAITAAKLASNAVETAKIKDAAVETAKINDSAVTTAKIADSAVTAAKLASNAVETAKIKDAAVETAKINDSAVTTAKIADSAVTKDKLANTVTVTPKNMFDRSAAEEGKYLNPNGTWENINNRMVSDYIPVTVGKKVVTSYATSDTDGAAVTKNGYAAITCFDSSKTVKTGGNYNSNGFTVPAGVSYVRVTLAKNASWHWQIEERDDTTPTIYNKYFTPYLSYSEDFLTAESEAAVQKIINGTLTTKDLENRYACAFPRGYTFRQTVGLPESWYYSNAISPLTPVNIGVGIEYYSRQNDKITFQNDTALNSANGYSFSIYDALLARTEAYTGSGGFGDARKIVAESLADCSCLVIGDSTVDQDTMTQDMLDYFTSKSKTLTLLGTLGSGSNKNEGRAGWKATDYLTNKQYEGVTNPFYNPDTATFDFSYYMTNQEYSAPDFVIIQLGINDLYNYGETAIEPAWLAVKAMIDSILSYSDEIKILLNLPTAPNSDESKHSAFLPLYQNRVIKYNEYAMAQALKLYGQTKVRPTYCHLILDPSEDINDNVHPNSGGYLKMAKEVINQINVWQSGN